MKNNEAEKINTLLHDMSILQPKDSSKIERMSKYVKNADKNVFICLHPSAMLHYYHTHDFYEINYVYEGNCINMVEGNSLRMITGDFILFHPGTFHTLYADTKSKVVNILIRPCFFTQHFSHIQGESPLSLFISKIGQNSYYKYVIGQAQIVRQNITSLMMEEIQRNLNADLIQEAELTLLLCFLMRSTNHSEISDIRGISSNIIIDMLQYMYEHYNNMTLSVMSKHFSYSPAHICRMFASQTGKTFSNTLIEIRMEKAASFLKESNMKVCEIARTIGYESVEYFHRLFKAQFGITPLQFRSSSSSGFEPHTTVVQQSLS